MNTPLSRAEGELYKCVVQDFPRDDPYVASWIPSIEDEVVDAQFNIAEQRPAGDHQLLALADIGTPYAFKSLTIWLCGVTTETVIKEKEDGEQLISISLDRLLSLAVPYPRALFGAVANAP